MYLSVLSKCFQVPVLVVAAFEVQPGALLTPRFVYTCIYIYIYTHTYIHVVSYIYIYIYTHIYYRNVHHAPVPVVWKLLMVLQALRRCHRVTRSIGFENLAVV